MHILLIPAWFETPARPTAGKAVKDLAYALALEGYKINILFQSGAHLPSLQKLNNRIEIWFSHYSLRGKLFPVWNMGSLLAYQRVFKKYIEKHGIPDLIHIQNYTLLPLALMLFRKYGIKSLYTEHSSKIAQGKINLVEKFLIRYYLGKHIQTVAVSNFLKSGLIKLVPDLPVKVIPNTVDFNYFIPSSKPLIPQLIMINLLNKNKQVDLGIRVFALWLKKHPEAQMHIIGDGPEKKPLEQLARNLGVMEQITWWGEIQEKDWLPVLQQSSALLFLSKMETFGVVVIEALACKVPVIALENKGIEDILSGERIPILPIEAEAPDIVDALEKLLAKDNAHLDRIREELQFKFDYPVVAKLYTKEYNALLHSINGGVEVDKVTKSGVTSKSPPDLKRR